MDHKEITTLDSIFYPKTVAVVGAKDTPGSVGCTLVHNLLNPSFQGKIYPVNPKRNQVLGAKCYPSVKEIPEQIDLVVIATPAETVPQIIQECADAKVKSAVIISAGFKELGESGRKLEEEFLKHAHRGGMRIIGPNCLGVMTPIHHLNATFARGIALPGHIAFISQSGAMCTAVLEWSHKQKVGFSAIASVGSMSDMTWGTLIDYFGNDPNTHSILIYMETIDDVRSFMTAARDVAFEKPIIIIKAGKSQAAANVAASHSGSLATSNEVLDAALERIGVLRVYSIGDFFSLALLLNKQPLPKGPNLTILTNTGGIAVLTTDAAVTSHASLTHLSEKTLAELDKDLPAAWSHGNPVDILGDALADRYRKALEILVNDPDTDGILTIVSPQDMTDPTTTAEEMTKVKHAPSKLILASLMGGENAQEGIDILSKTDIPNYDFPDEAAKTFATLWQYNKNIKMLYETPAINRLEGNNLDRLQAKQHVEKIINDAKQQKRELLTEDEAKHLLENYHIPVVRKDYAMTSEDKYQLLLGSFTDPQFGPVLYFGLGGDLVEILKDYALAIPPLNKNLARYLIEKTKIYQALRGTREGNSIDLSKLEDIVINFSLMITENKRIKECEINPLMASDQAIMACNIYMALHDSKLSDESIPQLAVRPYPLEYADELKISDEEIIFRPIKPEDEQQILEFYKKLSEHAQQSLFGRMTLDENDSHKKLIRLCFNDYDRELTIIIEAGNKVIGIGYLYRFPNTAKAQLKTAVISELHQIQLETQMLKMFIKIAEKEKIGEIYIPIPVENTDFITICKNQGLDIKQTEDSTLVSAVYTTN